YKHISEILESSTLTQRRVAGLISELDMMGIIHARVKSFGRAGRTREIELGSKEVMDLIKSDVLFKKLKNYKNVKQTTLI
ncbi:MAG: cell division control protein Cdc6, partial [Candidatus Methanomethylophilaceae archaeon]